MQTKLIPGKLYKTTAVLYLDDYDFIINKNEIIFLVKIAKLRRAMAEYIFVYNTEIVVTTEPPSIMKCSLKELT